MRCIKIFTANAHCQCKQKVRSNTPEGGTQAPTSSTSQKQNAAMTENDGDDFSYTRSSVCTQDLVALFGMIESNPGSGDFEPTAAVKSLAELRELKRRSAQRYEDAKDTLLTKHPIFKIQQCIELE